MPQPSKSTRAGKKGGEHRAKTNRSQPTDEVRGAKPLFPIVGIGASAGGLEALDLFLRNVPADSSIAFVIVQHLEPTHKSSMRIFFYDLSREPLQYLVGSHSA